MEINGEILGIVPFKAITYSLLTKNSIQLRCGAGIDFFAITTDGRVIICLIPPSIDFAVVGDITKTSPGELVGKKKKLLNEPFMSCDELGVCGGRCLYTNKTKHWGEDGFNLVYAVTKSRINELRNSIPRINNMINKKTISIQDFNYPEIPNGVEIIP